MARLTVHHWVPTSELGGVETALDAFLRGSSGTQNVVFAGDLTGPAVDLWRKSGAEVVHVPGWTGMLGAAWSLNWRRAVRAAGVARLIVWSPTRLGMLLAALPSDSRVLVHIGTTARFGFRARVFAWLHRVLFPASVRPRLILCSQVAAQSHAESSPLDGWPRQVIHNAVRPEFLLEHGGLPVGRTWGMVARLDSSKDHAALLRATALIVRRLPDFQLRLVGEGPLRPSLESQVADLGLGGHVRLLGRRENPWKEASTWQGFVFSTTAVEGFGIAVAEAMALGLPCVLSDLPVMREVAGDAAEYFRCGSSEDLARAVLGLAGDEERRRRLAKEARALARGRYAPQAFAEAYLAALSAS